MAAAFQQEIPRHLPVQEAINVRGGSPDSYRERMLSNFSPHSFLLAGSYFANVEAFVQCIKHPEGSDARQYISQMPASKAKRCSMAVPPDVIEWMGREITYRSREHYQLQATAIFAKFDQNEIALEALLATGQLPLTHDLGRPEKPTTCLPAAVFTQILVETRAYYFVELGVPSLSFSTDAMYVTPETVAYTRQEQV